MDEMTLTLNSPITEEQWDMIEDVDFDHTDSITFHTKHGKEVEFVKRKTGKWIEITDHETPVVCKCTECGWLTTHYDSFSFCPNCGADMREQP